MGGVGAMRGLTREAGEAGVEGFADACFAAKTRQAGERSEEVELS